MRVVLDFYRGLAASSLACTYSTDLGQAEVGDADVALVVEQHVLRLEVAVDHLG